MFYKKKKTISINQKLDAQTKKTIDDARQLGVSSWLRAISVEQYGFPLKKSNSEMLYF